MGMEANVPVVSVPVPFERTSGLPGRGGMVQAFEELFLAEYPRVVGIAARVLADRSEAEDVAQEVFLAFHRSHSPLAEYGPAWLHRAAWHTALNRVRGRRRRERREMQDALSQRPDAWSADPQGIVERTFDQERVRSALRRLPPRSAGVLALRYSGLSYVEVAAAMGIGVGQIGTMLRRAEARLKREVES